MCGRFTLALTGGELAEALGLDVLPEGLRARYNIAPTQGVAAVLGGEPRVATWLRWGLVPHWAKDVAIGNRLINARSETLADKPAFRRAFGKRRCLILADGFFEWRKEGKAKQPYHVRAASGRPFTFAGLWESWRAPGSEEPLRTCTIVTTEASDALRPLHDRMPLIVPPDRRGAWVDPEGDAAATLAELVGRRAELELEARPVTPRVSSPAFDDPSCVVPVGPPLAATGPSQPELWGGDDLADGRGADEEHDEAVDAEGRAGRARHRA